MRIALVILHADPARGGAERYTVDLANALILRGHEVILLSSSFPATGLMEKIKPVVIAAPGLTRTGRYRAFLDHLDAHLSGEKYDVIHAMLPVRRCDVYHPHAGVAAESLASGHLKHQGCLVRSASWLFNQLDARRRQFAATERQLLGGPCPPVVLCLSQYVKDSVLRHYDIDASRLVTLLNGTDLKRFDPDAEPESRSRLRRQLNLEAQQTIGLMIAQDFQRKGLAQTLQAMSQVNDPDQLLVVAGRPDPRQYQQLAQRLGIAQRVRFVGPTSDPAGIYRMADFFVLPTRHDPCSLVVLEALAMGLPVISTVFNGACEVMEDGVHGFVLSDPGNINALASAMRTMQDSVRRKKMALACLSLRPALSYETHLDGLLQIYSRLCQARS